MKKQIVLLLAMLVSIALPSCKKQGTNSPANSAKINLRLTDAPANYDAVVLDIQQIEFKQEGRSTIVLYPYRRGPYDLLRFRNGIDTLLVNASVPPGKIEQIRLILGGNSYVIDDGKSYPLNTPSAQESGVKLNLHETLDANVSYDIWLDFDAGKSVTKKGNGSYSLKPVIRAYTAITDGRIEGNILPLSAFATVYANNGVDEYAEIPSRVDGRFVFTGLPEGHYSITVVPGVAGFVSFTTDVNITFGQVTNVGTITLVP